MIKSFLKYPLGFNSFDLQLFAEGDSGDAGGGSAEPTQVVYEEMTDPVSGSKVKVPAELKAFLGHIITKTRTDTEGKFKPMLETLESQNADLVTVKSEYEKLKEASMTAEERAQENARKKIIEHETTAKKASEEATAWKGRFEKTMVKNDIMSSFGDSKLCNPSQVASLFEMEGNAFVSEVVDDNGKSTGEFETRVKIMLEDKNGNPELIEGTPSELFKKWISLDRNAHHLLNTMASGSGTRAGSYKGGMTNDQFNNLHPTEKLKRARQN